MVKYSKIFWSTIPNRIQFKHFYARSGQDCFVCPSICKYMICICPLFVSTFNFHIHYDRKLAQRVQLLGARFDNSRHHRLALKAVYPTSGQSHFQRLFLIYLKTESRIFASICAFAGQMNLCAKEVFLKIESNMPSLLEISW